MWVTKNGQSKDFYDPEDLRLYLNDMSAMAVELSPQNLPSDTTQDSSDALLSHTPSEGRNHCGRKTHHRERDPERLLRPNGGSGKVLLAVAHYTQKPGMDKSCS
ncbi:hypothetical protein NDU88_003064 [Pleurodeles waltl]|uniref:Uncharacterized protein n=1 Tax=Pleurodeles waltl TaxID=8319 RepID=A0AAV7UXX9_PLEWA|nr:hypothetical protein NDU88_003064 [Pleurodeles waltl]